MENAHTPMTKHNVVVKLSEHAHIDPAGKIIVQVQLIGNRETQIQTQLQVREAGE